MSSSPHDTRSAPTTTQKYAGWAKGMNNVLADHELPADMLRDAADVDILDSGKLRRRKGTTLLSATPAHSLWTNGSIALGYSGGTLNRVNEDDSLSVLVSGLSNRPISYTEAGLDIFWSNGLQYGRLEFYMPAEWGVARPLLSPTLATTTGLLFGGTYQVAVSFVSVCGEESAASLVRTVTVPDSGGLVLTDIPQPADILVPFIRVYVSHPNGDVLYRVADLGVDTLTYTITTPPVWGQALRTEHMDRFPPCDMIEHWRGRIYGAQDNIMLCTEPFAFGLHTPAKNFYMFPTGIRLIVGVLNGLFVVCDKTYWLEGTSPEDFKQREILPYGAARRGFTRVPDSEDVMWMSDRGLVVGSESGKITGVQAANVMPGAYDDASLMIREQNSIRQVMVVARGQTRASQLPAGAPPPTRWQEDPPQGLVIGDFMSATVNS